MKDGKRSKKESATIDKKASGSKKSFEASRKSKVPQIKPLVSKASGKTDGKVVSKVASKAASKAVAKSSAKKQRSERSGKEESASIAKAAKTNGRSKEAVRESAELTFTNPVVESAFNRALKKYATALKHLTD